MRGLKILKFLGDSMFSKEQSSMHNYISDLSKKIFSVLQPSEELGLFLHSEESLFLRFNSALVRQNTSVHQHELTLTYQKNKRVLKQTYNLKLDLFADFEKAQDLLQEARVQLPLMDENPSFVPLQNGGTSATRRRVERPHDEEIPELMTQIFSGTDMVGIWCSGPLRQASLNSLGQFHFFENDFFYFDYSLYNGPRAAKGYYAAEKWSLAELQEQAQLTKNKLSLLSRPVKNIQRGKYRAYLEPMAVQEILGTMSWGGFSRAVFEQGRSPLKKLGQKELKLSEKFTLSENLGLGFVPIFNSTGELAPLELELIKNGVLENFLTSSGTAQEYGLKSNFASPQESPRSLEVRAGALQSAEALQKLEQGLYLSNLHYINWSDQQSARLTGMTRFACFWVENGEIQGPINDLRFDESVYNIFGANLLDLTAQQSIFVDTLTYLRRSLGVNKVPGALVKDFNFTL